MNRSVRHSGRSGLLFSAAVALLFAAAPAAFADDTTSYYNFNGSASTDWMNGANWTSVVDLSTGTLPGPGSTADISGGKTATIGTVANPNPTISVEQVYIGGDADMHGPATLPNPTPPPPFTQYPAIATGNGELDQNAGTLNVGVVDPANTTSNNGWFVLGHVNGATGTYKMSGTATLNLSNDAVQVGTNGNGVLSMTDSATINTPFFTAGRWRDGHGVGTGTATVTIGGNATLNSAGDMRVGDQGIATLTQSGGTVNATGGSWVDIGRETGSQGTYTMTGGTLNLGTTAAGHNADLNVGNDGTGTFAQSGTSAVSQVNGWIFIARQANVNGDNNGSTLAPASGTYTLSDTASLTTAGRIYVGGSGQAIGTAGSAVGNLTVGTKAGDNPSVSAGDEIHVGDGGTGTLTQNSGSVSETANAWIKIGRAGGTGTYTLNNGSVSVNDTIAIGADGSNGTGTFNIAGGTVNATNRIALGQNGGGNNHGTVNQTAGDVTTNEVRVGWDGGNQGTYSISGGTLTVNGGLHIAGNGGNGTPATGTFNLSGTGSVTTTAEIDMGDGGNATMNVSGGTLSVGGRFNMAGGQSPVVNQTGGSIMVSQDLNVGDNNGTVGTYNMSGGTLQPGLAGSGAGGGVGGGGGALDIGWNNTGTFNQTGGTVDLSSTSAHGLQFNGNGGGAGNGTYNLSGGVLLTPIVFKSPGAASTATFNFNGGTLRAAAADNVYATGDNFMGNLTTATVQAGGAVIDVNGFAITISQNLLHSGATTDGGLTLKDTVGGGSLTLTGNNTFNGVTNALAGTLNVNNANALGGSTLNLVPANAGTVVFDSGATGITAFTLGGLSGSVNLSLRTASASNFALTVGGNGSNTTYSGVLSNGLGLTKAGTGTLILTAPQTYGGPTAINGGTLRLNGTGSLPASSAVTVGGPSPAASDTPTIAGNGSVLGSVTVSGSTGGNIGGHVSPGSSIGSIGTLSVGSLTLGNGSVLDYDVGAPGVPFGASDLTASTGALTLPTSGSVVLNLTNAGGFGVGTYRLITESSTTNFTPTRFSIGTGLPFFQEAFSNPGGTEVDMIVTPAPTWKAVAVSNDWADPNNWLNGVPGSTSGLSSDIASFVTNSNFLNPTPDLNRDVSGIIFDQAAVGVYVIGSTGGNALSLTPGGTIQTTSLVANTETINAPLVIQGTDSTYTFSSNASDNTKSLVFGGSVSATGGNTVLTLTGSNTSNNAVNGVISNGTATSLSLVKNGAGTWVLGGNNTFSGGVLLSSGTLAVGHNNALGTGTLTGDGGTLQASTGGPFTVGNSVTILSGLTVGGANDFTLSGAISGAGPLTVAGSNTVTLTHNNTFGGGVSLNSGTLRVGNNGALGTGTLTAGGGALSTDANGPYTVSNSVNLASNLTVSGASDLTLNGAIGGTGGLNKTGANTLTLSGASAFSGGVTVNGGTVNVGPATPSSAFSALGTGAVTLTGTNPTLNLRGYSSSGPGLLGQYYNVAPANVGNQDPAYNALTTMNAQLNGLGTPTVTAATNVGGKADLNFTNGGTLNPDPNVGGFTGGGAREYIFNKAGASTAAYGFPTPIPFQPAGSAPGGTVGLDNFQVRMSGFINITKADTYTFTTTSDDGSVLFIDGGDGIAPNDDIPLVNNNVYQGMTLKSGSVALTAGLHAISVGYYEGGGGLGLGVTYADQDGLGDTGGLMVAIPNSVLSFNTAFNYQSYLNNVAVTADSTINITGSGLNASMGALTIGSGAPNVTLNVTSNAATPYSLTFNGNTTLAGNSTINVANGTGGGAGQVNLSTIGGAFSLTKTGPGVLSISGAGTYSGGTVVSAGTVIANGPGSIGTGAATFNNTSTLRLAGIGNAGFVPVIPNLDNTAATWTVNGTAAGAPPLGFNGTGNATTLQLTDSMNNEQSSAWFNTPQAINNSLQVKFTYQMTGGGTNPADGMAFVIQNDPAGTAALGGGGGNLGYVGITKSAAFEINVYNGHTIGTAFAAGSSGNYNTVSPVNLIGDGTTGDVINVTLVYNAITGTITQTLNDTTNNTSFTSALPLGTTIANIIGSNNALIGFTGATGGLNCTHTISNFEFDPATSSVYTNNVVVNGGSNATIDVGTTTAVATVGMGSLTVNSGAGTTLNVTATTAPPNTNYELDFASGVFNGNVGVNIANNGTGTGTMRVGGPSTFANGVAVNLNSGHVKFTNSGAAASVGTGVSVTVASAATLELAGTTSNLSNPATAAQRVNVINSSTQAGGGGLVFSGTNQQVGGIDGVGDTVVKDGASGTANHIIQHALIIGSAGASPARMTIAGSDASGNPLAGGLAVAGSLDPGTPFGSDSSGGSSGALALDNSSSSSLGAPVGGGVGGSGASVPEPSSVLLLLLGGLACLAPVVRRRRAKA